MNPRIIALIGFALLIFGAGLVSLVGLGLMSSSSEGENPNPSQSETTTGTDITPVNPGNLNGRVPELLAELFKAAGGSVGVPAALLAAVSNQECGRTWDISEAILRPLIEKNEDFPLRGRASSSDLGHMGCAYDNGSNVWGPMQFQYMTFFGFPNCTQIVRKRCVRWTWENKHYYDRWAQSFVAQNPNYHPGRHPQPLSGAAGGQTSSFTGKNPASILSMKDAVYAAAIKLKADSGRSSKAKSAEWSLDEISRAACRYYGQCSFDGVNYQNDITRKYKRYSEQLPS